MNKWRWLCVMGLLALAASPASWSQSRPAVVSSMDMEVPIAPTPVTIGGRQHLAYELRLANFRAAAVTLTRLEIIDAVRGTRVGDFQDVELGARLGRLGATSDPGEIRRLGPGTHATVYMWLAIEHGVATPSALRHRLTFDMLREGRTEGANVEGAEVTVHRTAPIVLDPPLGGGPWVALYDPMMNGGHRRAMYAVGGRARIPARFAIDWIRLEDDGSVARGSRSEIANWHGYGADVLAVADAVVVEANDDIDEPPSLSRAPVALENASGNFVALNLGGGRYAFYEHLKRGSLRVKAGDRVKSGQVLAQLGNSGSSSSGPHLHFHVADGASELASEGLPYTFRGFDVVGAFDTIAAFSAGGRWKPAAPELAGPRRRELPAANTVIVFPAMPQKP